MRILVIEDDEGVRGMIVRMLTDDGHEILEAGDGRSGLEHLEAHPDIDLTVTDILMPVMEGLETIRVIRKRFPGMRTLAISGGGQFGPEYCLDLARKMGASATLQKPFIRNELLDAITDAMRDRA